MKSAKMHIEPFHWDSREAETICLSRNFVELFWIRSGSALIGRGQQIQELKAGHLLSLNTRPDLDILATVRGYHLRAERQLVTTCVPEPLPAPLRHFLQQLAEPWLYVHFSQRGRAEAEWYVHQMLCDHGRLTDVARTWIRLALAQFLLLCCTEWITAELDKETISTSGESVVQVLCEYIDQHFHENLGLKELSHRAGYAPCYLSSLFSRARGQGLNEYITRKRIARAQQLLKSSELRVIDICYQVGFRDLAHFNHTFKRYVGFAPNQYRRSSFPGILETVQIPHAGLSEGVSACGLPA